MIYFIEAKGAGAVKIGWAAANLQKRVQQLQCGCPIELDVVGTVPGTRRMEHRLHLEMVGYNVRGEWFEAEAAKAVYTRILDVGYDVTVAELSERVRLIRSEVQKRSSEAMVRVGELWPNVSTAKRGKLEIFISHLISARPEDRNEIFDILHGDRSIAEGGKAA